MTSAERAFYAAQSATSDPGESATEIAEDRRVSPTVLSFPQGRPIEMLVWSDVGG